MRVCRASPLRTPHQGAAGGLRRTTALDISPTTAGARMLTDAREADLRTWAGHLVATFGRTGTSSSRSLVAIGSPTVETERDHAQLLGAGRVVVKLHAARTDPAALEARLAAIQRPELSPFWVQPLWPEVFLAPDGRVATAWPRVHPLATSDPVPWAQAGRLLAALHQAAVDAPASQPPLPDGGATRVRRAADGVRLVDRRDLLWLADLGDRLADGLARRPANAWVHGDFHLGQLARDRSGAHWLLLDVDDMGIGDPAWDLARPAGFWAAGLLEDRAWRQFLAAYRLAGGPGIPAGVDDPWPCLDVPAQAAVVIAASRAITRSGGASVPHSLLAACRKMRERTA